MPTLEANKKDLETLIGKKFKSRAELEEALMYAKAELDGLEGDELKIDVKDTNRPDLWSIEGIAREIKGRIGKEKGIPVYKVGKSKVKAKIEKGLENIRPKAAYAVAKNIMVTDELIRQMVQLQEKICQSFGGKREQVAIGIFDFDKIKGNVRYYAADPEFEFVPLGYRVKMNLAEILEEHPKGIEYGKLLKKFKKYPLLVDEEEGVLSMPPIINSEESGKITEKTRNLFIDITGFDQEKINVALRIVCCALADRGAKIESVELQYPNGKKLVTPNFKNKKFKIRKEYAGELSGLDKTDKQFETLLKQARYNVKNNGVNFEIEYPSYRQDILHEVDVIEDIIISEGFNSIEPATVSVSTIGNELCEVKDNDVLRDCCIGIGLQEVLTFTLTSREKQERKMCTEEQNFVEIENPVSENWSVYRKSILPELLEFLGMNKHAVYPQRIFEIGKTVHFNKKSDTGVTEKNKLCLVLASREANFTHAKSALQAVCNARKWKFSLTEKDDPRFEKGRCAEISIGKRKGIVGEINKKVLSNFGIEMPVAAVEIEL